MILLALCVVVLLIIILWPSARERCCGSQKKSKEINPFFLPWSAGCAGVTQNSNNEPPVLVPDVAANQSDFTNYQEYDHVPPQ